MSPAIFDPNQASKVLPRGTGNIIYIQKICGWILKTEISDPDEFPSLFPRIQ